MEQVEEDGMALPAHERKAEALKDLEEIRPKLHTNVKFRRNRAKVSEVDVVPLRVTRQRHLSFIHVTGTEPVGFKEEDQETCRYPCCEAATGGRGRQGAGRSGGEA